MSNGNGGDILIKSGSVSLDYDEKVYPPPTHTSSDMKIMRIVITDASGKISFDSGEHPTGLQATIAVICK
jgi:hypothetical protein